MTVNGHEAVARIASQEPGLDLLVLFGSRARDDATERSDWDFGYLVESRFDRDRFLAHLVATLGTEHIDLVDLARAGALVRFRAARDGVIVFEARPDAFSRFWLEAVGFWCDMGATIRAGYDGVLAELGR